mmetsp:Transcript_22547/g.48908  ORF Transcript_22547/g.48908 Transcript_22547/m.48908 type:complete len:125 (+) Transcript_22547:165-539(+)
MRRESGGGWDGRCLVLLCWVGKIPDAGADLSNTTIPSFHRPPGSWIRDHASGAEILTDRAQNLQHWTPRADLQVAIQTGVLLPRFHSDETEHEFAAYYRAVNFAHVRALITILVAAALTMNQSV